MCSSTLVYLLMSSLFVSSCAFTLRNQILNQISLMGKFNNRVSVHGGDALNTTYVNTNESVSSKQASLHLNQLSNSQDSLDYLIIDQIQPESSENTSETNFNKHNCFLHEKFNEIRLSVQDFFGFDVYETRHRPPRIMRTGLFLEEQRSIQFLNSHHHNIFQIMT